jgi:hypothetical protein
MRCFSQWYISCSVPDKGEIGAQWLHQLAYLCFHIVMMSELYSFKVFLQWPDALLGLCIHLLSYSLGPYDLSGLKKCSLNVNV